MNAVGNSGSYLFSNFQNKQEYLEKRDYLEANYERMSPECFYDELFSHCFEPKGFDCSKSSGIGNPIVVSSFVSDGEEKMRSRIITEAEHSTFYNDYKNCSIALIAPCVFYGRTALSKNARYIYALVVDLDYVGLDQLQALLNQIYNAKLLPVPTYIVNSGTGLHLYYVSNEPYPAYPQTRTALGNLKKALIRICWNGYTSRQKPSPKYDCRQYAGVTQGYRIIGTPSKLGPDYPVTAYRVGDTWDFRDLTQYLHEYDQKFGITEDSCLYKSELPLAQAKEKYPDWYQRRIIEQKPKGTFTVKNNLFDWFLKKILQEGTVGHRYYCVGMLAVYAIKTDTPKEEVLKALDYIVPLFNELGSNENNAFLREEAEKAINTWYKPEFKTLPINSIIHFSAIDIKKSKRNGRDQKTHLKYMRMTKQFKVENGECSAGGRPDKQKIVAEWRKNNPDGTKAECIKATGLTKPTVYKWW